MGKEISRGFIKMSIVRNLGKIIYKKTLKLFAGSGLRSFKIIEKINLFVRIKLKPDFIITKKYGHKMFLDKIDSLYLSVNKDWGNYEKEILENNIQEGDVVLDIGANIGFYTLIMAKLVGEKGRVYAFEADPTNFNILKKNIQVNGYKNVVAINKAVLDCNKTIKFYIDEGNTAGNSLFKGDKQKYNEVDAIKLDDYFSKREKIDFVKIDIEGSKGRAIKGMTNLLDKNKKIKIITEFYPKLLNGVGKEVDFNAEDYLKFLRKKGFKLYDIDDKTKSLVLLSDKEILEKCGKQWTNLLCVKQDLKEKRKDY